MGEVSFYLILRGWSGEREARREDAGEEIK